MWKIIITDQGPPKVLIVNILSNLLLETNMNLYCATQYNLNTKMAIFPNILEVRKNIWHVVTTI